VIIGIITTTAADLDQRARSRSTARRGSGAAAGVLLRSVTRRCSKDDVGLRLDAHGYDFLRHDARYERWQPVMSDLLLRERTLPDGSRRV
jgi:hypothetical protein